MNEDDVLGIIFTFLFVIIILIACFCQKIDDCKREIVVLKAKAIKAGVATMTYDIENGKETFIFEVGK